MHAMLVTKIALIPNGVLRSLNPAEKLSRRSMVEPVYGYERRAIGSRKA